MSWQKYIKVLVMMNIFREINAKFTQKTWFQHIQ